MDWGFYHDHGMVLSPMEIHLHVGPANGPFFRTNSPKNPKGMSGLGCQVATCLEAPGVTGSGVSIVSGSGCKLRWNVSDRFLG